MKSSKLECTPENALDMAKVYSMPEELTPQKYAAFGAHLE